MSRDVRLRNRRGRIQLVSWLSISIKTHLFVFKRSRKKTHQKVRWRVGRCSALRGGCALVLWNSSLVSWFVALVELSEWASATWTEGSESSAVHPAKYLSKECVEVKVYLWCPTSVHTHLPDERFLVQVQLSSFRSQFAWTLCPVVTFLPLFLTFSQFSSESTSSQFFRLSLLFIFVTGLFIF